MKLKSSPPKREVFLFITLFMKYQNLLQTIGDTPVIKLRRYSHNPKVTLLAKLEGTNPGGSIKDRVALFMILDAQKKGLLEKDKTIIEATSGNTGIGLAMLSAYFGYKFIAVIPETASIERRKLLEAYGSDVVVTDGKLGTNHAIKVVEDIIKKNSNKYIQLNQFSNIMNASSHYATTGKEIIHAVPKITHFVVGMGTGGTLMGVGKRLKEFNPKIQIIGVEPKISSAIQGLRNMKAYTPSVYQESALDKKLELKYDEPAFELARDLFRKEGLSVGISSGAALWGAIEISKTLKQGTILTIFPDKGDRYTSTRLFTV